MRHPTTDVAIRCEIGFEEDLMRRLIEGTRDCERLRLSNSSTVIRLVRLAAHAPEFRPWASECVKLRLLRPQSGGTGVIV